MRVAPASVDGPPSRSPYYLLERSRDFLGAAGLDVRDVLGVLDLDPAGLAALLVAADLVRLALEAFAVALPVDVLGSPTRVAATVSRPRWAAADQQF